MNTESKLPRGVYNEVVCGLQKMLALRLPNSPAADTIGATVAVWEEALSHNRVWHDEQDVKRVQTAFKLLAIHLDRFPLPCDFFKVLPKPTPPPMLAYRFWETEEEKTKGKEQLNKMIKQILNRKRI